MDVTVAQYSSDARVTFASLCLGKSAGKSDTNNRFRRRSLGLDRLSAHGKRMLRTPGINNTGLLSWYVVICIYHTSLYLNQSDARGICMRRRLKCRFGPVPMPSRCLSTVYTYLLLVQYDGVVAHTTIKVTHRNLVYNL